MAFENIIRADPFEGIKLQEQIHKREPMPFKYDGLDYMREGVGRREMDITLLPLVRPFLNTGYNAASAYNRSLGTFFEHLDCMADFVADTTGLKKGEGDLFQRAANIYDNNAVYWQNQAQRHGSTFLDEMLGEAIGGAPVGITEFIAGIPYAGFLGAAEAHKEGRNVVVGALTEGAKRGILGGIFKMISPLRQYLRAPVMGGTFAIQSASEGAGIREVVKSGGTGFFYSMASPGGQMGLNEIRSNLRVQLGMKGRKHIPKSEELKADYMAERAYQTIEGLKIDPEASSAHRVRNNIMKLASETRKLKKTDPAGYRKGMTELGKMEAAYNKSAEFGKWMEEHNRHLKPQVMKEEKIAYSQPGVVEMIRERRTNLDLANYETNFFCNELERTLSKLEREAIPFIIEKTGASPKLGRLDLENLLSKPEVPVSGPELTKRYVKETGEKIDTKEDLLKVQKRFPDEWAQAKEAETYKKELWGKLPEEARYNRGISEYTTKELEKKVGKPKTKLEEIAQKVTEHFDKSWQKIVEQSPEMSVREIENYVTHIWDVPKARKQEITSWFITDNRFLKKRYIENINAGIEKGLVPKTLDVTDIIRIHDSVTNRVIENNKFVSSLDKLSQDGMPMILRADKAPSDWVYYDHPALKKQLVTKKELVKGEEISPELINILEEVGVCVGRKLDPHGNQTGVYWPGEQKIQIMEKAPARTLAHEVGHHLDHAMGLTEAKFLDQFKDELYAVNKERIERFPESEQGYVRSPPEQTAEFFAELFTKPEKTAKVAPGATSFILDIMSKDGKLSRLIDFDFEKSAKQLIKEQMLMIHKLPVKVHPDLKKPLDVIFQEQMQHDAVQGYEMANGILKKTWLSLSLFHHLALTETSIPLAGVKKTGKIIFNPVKIYRALAKNEFDVFEKTDLAKDFIGHTGQVGATVDIPVAMIQRKLNDWAFKSKDVPLLNRTTEFLASFNKQWDKALWSYLHDSLKIYGYESLVAKLDPKLDIKKQKIEMAQLVNDTFGGQSWEALMVSPRTLQVARWMLLSPDWTYSTIRQALAPTGVGAIFKETKGLRQKTGAMFWMKAALYYGVGINALNAAFRAQDEKQYPEFYPESPGSFMWNNTIGHKTHLFLGRWEDGSERYLRWGKQFRELPELFWDSTGGFSPVSASLKKIGGKIAPGLQVASQTFTGYSWSGFRNRDIAAKQGWERVAGIAKTLMKTPLPFMARNLMTEGKEFHLTDMAMPSSKGFTRYKAIDYFKTAIYRKDEVLLREVYQDVLRNNLPAHTLFHTALVTVKAESTREYNKELSTIKDIDIRLKTETDPAAIRRLTRLRKRMLKENMDRRLGLLLLDKSVAELNK